MRKSAWLALGLVLVLGFFIYLPGANGYFFFDDTVNILENKNIRVSDLGLASISRAALSGGAGPLGRPLSMISFAINYFFYGLDPFHFKVVNIVIHLLNGVCLFVFVFFLLNSKGGDKDKRNQTIWVAFAVAATWVLHPLNMMGVLYVVQRMTSLATLFVLLGLASYAYGRPKLIQSGIGWGWILAPFFLFTPLAALSKENGALLPVFLLLIEICFFKFNALGRTDKRWLLFLYSIFVVLPAILGCYYILKNPAWIAGGYVIRDFNIFERLLTESRVVLWYVRLTLFPEIAEMGVYHDDLLISRDLLSPLSTLFSVAILVFTAAISVVFIRRCQVISFGILFFLIGHSIESSIIGLELMHEHRNYLPMIGVLLPLFCWWFGLGEKGKGILKKQIISVFLIIGVFGGVTLVRASQWGDPLTMKLKEVEHHPNSIRANVALAAFYEKLPATSSYEAEKYYQLAYELYAKVSELAPSDTLGLFGLISLNLGHHIPLEESWISALEGRIEKYPFSPSTGNSIVNLERCVAAKKCEVSADVLSRILASALNNKTLPEQGRIQLLFARSDFLFRIQKNRENAVAEAFKAANIFPQDMNSQITLVNFLINMGELTDALKTIKRLRGLDGNNLYSAPLDEQEKLIRKIQNSN